MIVTAVSLISNYYSYHLAQHPDILSRLNTEIKSKLGGRIDFTHDNLKKIEYLENVLKESKFYSLLCLSVISLASCVIGLRIL